MTIQAGTRLGPYEILSPLGAGGMGEVYRSKDTRLGREVAIKVLRSGAADDPERHRRFEQEARAVAALNHPHICALYDIGREGDTDFLVMELVAGETLTARLIRGALPRGQAIELATQAALALATAHAAGIVHRDLKPGNIMLTESGVKLLDFGLAKLISTSTPAAALSSLPTEGSPVTGLGTIVGTLAYMAPEQLEGKPVDARSDLFAFGAVLYEMLTGRRAFEGATQASVITAIMSANPQPLTSFEPLTPPALDRVVLKCLAKDPRARWQSAADLADELKWISTGSGSAASGVVPRVTPMFRHGVGRRVAAALVIVGAGAGAAWWWAARSHVVTAPPREATHTQVTFSGNVQQVALSPDGATIAYVTGLPGSEQSLMVRDVTGSQAVEVWRGRGFQNLHAWMPDGRQILRTWADPTKEWNVQLVSRFGGAPRRVAGLNEAYVTVSPDGKQIAGAIESNPEFRVMAVDGGPVRTVALPGLRAVLGLRWSPSGKRVAVIGLTLEYIQGVWTVNSDGTGLRRIYSGSAGGSIMGIAWSPSDEALYVQSTSNDVGEVWRAPDATGDGRAAKPILTGLAPSNGLSVSADGDRLAQIRTTTTANLWRLDLTKSGAAPTPITQTSGALMRPHVSPDGHAIAAVRGNEIVKVLMQGGDPVPIVRGSNGSWSPDGRHLAFVADDGRGPRVFVGDADGQQATEIKGAIPGNNDVLWLPDGRLAWQTGDPQRWLQNYCLLDLATGHQDVVVRRPVGYTLSASFPPRGDAVALRWNRTPYGIGLWVVSGPEHTGRFLAADLHPAGWSSDARWIYAYRQGAREILRVNADTGKVEALGRFPAGELGMFACDVTPDHRALICSLEDNKSDVWIVGHFDPQAALAQK